MASVPAKRSASKRTEHPTLADVNKAKFFLLMPSGSLLVRTIVYPAQLIKTRMQAPVTAEHPGYLSARHAFREIVRQEGLRALYKGYFANALNMLNGPVYVLALESSQTVLTRWLGSLPEETSRPLVFLGSGACASFCAQTLAVPVDIVSQRIMVERQVAGRDSGLGGLTRPFRMLGAIVHTEGVRGLYRGFAVSLATYMPSSALFWSTYIALRGAFAPLSARVPAQRENWPRHWADTASVPVAGALAGMLAGALTTPIDVVRTQMQLLSGAERPTAWAHMRRMYRDDGGWRAFARGSSARVLQMGVTMTVIISLYETLKRISLVDESGPD